MMAQPSVAEDPQRRLHDCESHLRVLGEALASLPKEPDRYKQLGAELRVLVCARGQNRPLLLDLMDDYGVEYFVEPLPDLPFPITMVEDFLNPPPLDLEALSPNQSWERHTTDARPVPLRDFIDDALAVWIRPHAFSYRELIVVVAQQNGSAHEDDPVEEALVELERFVLGGFSGCTAPMRVAAGHALRAGTLLIQQAAQNHGVQPGQERANKVDARAEEKVLRCPKCDTEITTDDGLCSKCVVGKSLVVLSPASAPTVGDWSNELLGITLGLQVLSAVGSLLERALGGPGEGS